MYLDSLDVYQVRNLKENEILFCEGANFFYGANGSGKTALLEAIFLLGRGRSFRSRNIRTVISHDDATCTVFARLVCKQSKCISALGIKRERSGTFSLKHNGEALMAATALAELLPLQLINSESFQLLEGGPLQRRQFLDWGVFHVEHCYRDTWRQFQRCLKQRNSLLRHDRIDHTELAVWDTEFTRLSLEITVLRETYLAKFLPIFHKILGELTDINAVELSYFLGWDDNKSLSLVLKQSFERDRNTKTSNYGAHRADIRIKIAGRPAADVLSRGQIKILVCALRIAQGYMYKKEMNRQCVYLLDDLPSELDAQHRVRVGDLLHQLGAQVFVTGVFQGDLQASWPAEGNSKMFHVEHGVITPLSLLK